MKLKYPKLKTGCVRAGKNFPRSRLPHVLLKLFYKHDGAIVATLSEIRGLHYQLEREKHAIASNS